MIPILAITVSATAKEAGKQTGKQLAKKMILKAVTSSGGAVAGKILSDKVVKSNRKKGGNLRSSDLGPTTLRAAVKGCAAAIYVGLTN